MEKNLGGTAIGARSLRSRGDRLARGVEDRSRRHLTMSTIATHWQATAPTCLHLPQIGTQTALVSADIRISSTLIFPYFFRMRRDYTAVESSSY
jgi:hypothetical protein